MNKLTRNDYTEVGNDSTAQVSIRVCMHALRASRNDVRAMRAATTLVEAGYVVSLVDVEPDNECTASEENINGVNVHHIIVPGSFVTTRFNKRWVLTRALWMFLRATLRLVRTPADIYHALDLPALPACYIAARLRRKPLVFETYELPLCTLPTSELNTSRRLLQALLKPLLAHILPRCAAVIAVSPSIVQAMSQYYHIANVSLIRNIPEYQVVQKNDSLRHLLGLNSEERIALYQGNLQPGRGLERLVQSALFLERNITIVIMGKDEFGTQAQLESLIAREKNAERVKITPPVPYNELLHWTASADIGLIVNPPDYSLNIQMLLPNKLFEFLMAGLPVLSSPLECVVEVIRTYDVGLVLESLAPEDIGAAINAMLAGRDALARMRRNALHIAQKELNWSKEQDRLLRLYRGMLAKAPFDSQLANIVEATK